MQEVYSLQVSLHFVREEVLCLDLVCTDVETLFVFFYYIPHFQNGPVEVYFPESYADRKVILVENGIE